MKIDGWRDFYLATSPAERAGSDEDGEDSVAD